MYYKKYLDSKQIKRPKSGKQTDGPRSADKLPKALSKEYTDTFFPTLGKIVGTISKSGVKQQAVTLFPKMDSIIEISHNSLPPWSVSMTELGKNWTSSV